MKFRPAPSIFDIVSMAANPCRKKPRITFCGVIDTRRVLAVTDMAGPQVIICGHALSPALRSHKEAERLGKSIVKGKQEPTEKWKTLHN